MKSARLFLGSLLCLVVVASRLYADPPLRYKIIDLGTLGGAHSRAYSVNDLGQVVGTAQDRFGGDQPFLWSRKGGMEALPTLGLPHGIARDLNNAGQVVGSVSAPLPDPLEQAVLWEDGEARDLGKLGEAWNMDNETEAWAISSNGWVVGVSKIEFTDHAFIWDPEGSIRELASSSWAKDINDQGWVVGGITLWQDHSTPTEPFLDAGSEFRYVHATAINGSGQVTGLVGDIPTYDDYTHAFLWSSDEGLLDLGSLGGPDPEGRHYSGGLDVSDKGVVVGYSGGPGWSTNHAFVWTAERGMLDLNELVLNLHRWDVLLQAEGVNCSGDIVGWGLRTDGSNHAFLLRPIGGPMRRGDACADGVVDVADAICSINALFCGGEAVTCLDAADANDDGEFDVSDVVSTLGHLFMGWAALPAPGVEACSPDPTDDWLTCEAYPSCS